MAKEQTRGSTRGPERGDLRTRPACFRLHGPLAALPWGQQPPRMPVRRVPARRETSGGGNPQWAGVPGSLPRASPGPGGSGVVNFACPRPSEDGCVGARGRWLGPGSFLGDSCVPSAVRGCHSPLRSVPLPGSFPETLAVLQQRGPPVPVVPSGLSLHPWCLAVPVTRVRVGIFVSSGLYRLALRGRTSRPRGLTPQTLLSQLSPPTTTLPRSGFLGG